MRIVYIPRLDFKSFRSIEVISHLFQIVINFRSLERFFVVRVAQHCTTYTYVYSNCIATASASVGALLLNQFSTFYYAISNVLLAVSVKVPNQKKKEK